MPEVTITTPTKDTSIDENSINTKYGANNTLVLNREAVDGDMRPVLMQFSLASIPPGSQIVTAKLQVYQTACSAAFPVYGERILSANAAWVENNCDWVDMDDPTDWAGSSGCNTPGTDVASALLIDCNMPTDLNQYIDIALDPTEFQAMLDVGNYGFRIYAFPWGLVGVARTAIWHSKENPSGNYPKLVVSYVAPSTRLVKYFLNVWDKDSQIRDSEGRVVPPNEVQANEWIRLIGAGKVSPKTYEDLVADPTVSFIENVSYRYDENRVKIRASKESMLKAFLKRLGGVAG